MSLSFAVDLWDNFDAAHAHVTQGRQDVRSMISYLKTRIDIQASYCKGLNKLRGDEFKLCSSTNVFMVAKSCQEATKKAHLAQKDVFSGMVAAFETLQSSMKKILSSTRSAYNSASSDRNKKQSSCDSAFRDYKSAITNADNLYDAHEDVKPTGHAKNISKAASKLANAIKDVNKAHTKYTKAVEVLRQSQERYYKVLRENLEALETVHTQQLTTVDAEFKKFAASHQPIADDVAACTQDLTMTTNGANPTGDIQKFIQDSKKDEGPGYVTFVEFQQLSSTKIGHGPQEPIDEKSAPASDPYAQAEQVQYEQQEPAVQSTNDSGGEQVAIAQYDYTSDQPEDLQFSAGDVITLTACVEGEDWWTGTIGSNSGIFPASYVQIQGAADSAPAAEETAYEEPAAAEAATEEWLPEGTTPRSGQCRALYDFEAAGEDELDFLEGAILELKGEMPDWFYGTDENGKTGIFPVNFVEVL
jgi:hypothetical protein